MTQAGPSLSEIEQFIGRYRTGQVRAGPTGRVQMECPICGSGTAFSIVVDLAKCRSDKVRLGHWDCLSAKHQAPASGSWKDLLARTGASQQVQSGDGPAGEGRKAAKIVTAKTLAASSLKIYPEKFLPDAMADLNANLLKDQAALDYCRQRWGWTPEMIAGMDIGLSHKKYPAFLKTTDGGTVAQASPDRWFVFPYRWKDGDIFYVQNRLAPPWTDQYQRTFHKYPSGDDGNPCVPFNAVDLHRFVHEATPEDSLVVLEGEPDVLTFKAMFPDSFCIGMAGARNIPPLSIPLLRQIEPDEGVPRVVVIPDIGGEELANELARRVMGNRVGVCPLPKNEHGWKDFTDFVNKGGWTAEKALHYIENNRRFVDGRGMQHVADLAEPLLNMKISDVEGYRFHIPGVDKMFKNRFFKNPILPPGQFTVVIGPRKHRKSQLVMHGLARSALAGVPVVLDCREMAGTEIAETVFEMVNHRAWNTAEEMRQFASMIRRYPLFSAGLEKGLPSDPVEYEKHLEDWVASYGLKALVIDSITAIAGIGEGSMTKAMAWAQACKRWAAEYQIHIIMLAHVTQRDNEGYLHPLTGNNIRYFHDILSVCDRTISIQCVEAPDPGPNSLIQVVMERFSASGGKRVEVFWEGRIPYDRPGCWTSEVNLVRENMRNKLGMVRDPGVALYQDPFENAG